MKLYELNLELNEAVRRDLYGQLHNKELMEIEDETLFTQVSGHLHDERDDGEARGDHVLPSELKRILKQGMKKLIDKYGFETLYGGHLKKFNAYKMSPEERNATAIIDFKMKKDKVIKANNKRKKIPLYSSVVVSFYEIFGKRKVVGVVTVYEPRTSKKSGERNKHFISLI